MSERSILEKLIQDGKDAEAKLKAMEVTYSIGDRFQGEGSKYVLAIIGHGNKVHLANMTYGTTCSGAHKVADYYKITPDELKRLYGCIRVTRYWDKQKGVRV